MAWLDRWLDMPPDLRSSWADWLGIAGFFITLATFVLALVGVWRIGLMVRAAIGGSRSADLTSVLQSVLTLMEPLLTGQSLSNGGSLKVALIELQAHIDDVEPFPPNLRARLKDLGLALDPFVADIDRMLDGPAGALAADTSTYNKIARKVRGVLTDLKSQRVGASIREVAK